MKTPKNNIPSILNTIVDQLKEIGFKKVESKLIKHLYFEKENEYGQLFRVQIRKMSFVLRKKERGMWVNVGKKGVTYYYSKYQSIRDNEVEKIFKGYKLIEEGK